MSRERLWKSLCHKAMQKSGKQCGSYHSRSLSKWTSECHSTTRNARSRSWTDIPAPQIREQIAVVIQRAPVAARVRVKTPFTPHQLVDKIQRRKEVVPPSAAAARELLR